ncbi:hypothetical protein chiPu_0023567, partial [Chiloscyllium punctatum]|nr:hypothetical protein [Chiloscyllium punctatum]
MPQESPRRDRQRLRLPSAGNVGERPGQARGKWRGGGVGRSYNGETIRVRGTELALGSGLLLRPSLAARGFE